MGHAPKQPFDDETPLQFVRRPTLSHNDVALISVSNRKKKPQHIPARTHTMTNDHSAKKKYKQRVCRRCITTFLTRQKLHTVSSRAVQKEPCTVTAAV